MPQEPNSSSDPFFKDDETVRLPDERRMAEIARHAGLDDEEDEVVSVYVDELPDDALRYFLREHLMWLFLAGGVAVVALILPAAPWYMALLRLVLFLVALIVGGLRLFQVNGITGEMHKRHPRDEESDQ